MLIDSSIHKDLTSFLMITTEFKSQDSVMGSCQAHGGWCTFSSVLTFFLKVCIVCVQQSMSAVFLEARDFSLSDCEKCLPYTGLRNYTQDRTEESSAGCRCFRWGSELFSRDDSVSAGRVQLTSYRGFHCNGQRLE